MTSPNRSRSTSAFKRAREIFPGGVNSPVRAFKAVESDPFVVSHGQGPYLYDLDGNRYVDYVLSWGPLVLGHAPEGVTQAISKQALRGTSFGASSELEIALGEQIQKCMPGLEMLRFVNSGTEAAMSAVRLARGYTNRNKIVKFSGCYHGHLDSLLVKAGSGVTTLSLPDCAGIPEQTTADTLSAIFNDLESVEACFKAFPDQIAAVIVEPVAGNCGLIKPLDNFLPGLREITKRYGALLIFDEVMTGFRVHPGGAQALYGVSPDLTMLGKVIGGGLPVGAFGGRRDIMSMLAPAGPVYQAGTLSGNPLAMAAGLATLQEWSEPGVFQKSQETAEILVNNLREISKKYSIPLQAEHAGTMFGFFFQEEPVINFESAKNSDLKRFRAFFHACLDRGVYFAPSQFEAGFVCSKHAGDPLDYTLSVVENALKACR
ncbi:MAG: glutamate-1-semialdehyde 2,1-aminomutase [Deltaproteobacteria bacterium]|nr:glutamate-1-semialdehyde 2,1-aminomutase [Deltaproteobacteria bacterium]